MTNLAEGFMLISEQEKSGKSREEKRYANNDISICK